VFVDLDQIAHFHLEIAMAMSYNQMCHKAPVVTKFADVMSLFVPCLTLYESYLVYFELFLQQIDYLSLDPANQFGSFVRMQSLVAGFWHHVIDQLFASAHPAADEISLVFPCKTTLLFFFNIYAMKTELNLTWVFSFCLCLLLATV
jgi:uncharacterized membrane protein